MNKTHAFIIGLFFLPFIGCQPAQEKEVSEKNTLEIPQNKPEEDTFAVNVVEPVRLLTEDDLAFFPDTALINVFELDTTFILDVKYATEDNFTKQVLYPCQRCLLRKEVALALVKAHRSIKEQGYFIKLFDCYRPNSVQWKMWKIYPDKRYVADPAKGSVHNRGGAVDLSLTNSEKVEIDMGSPYDFFGQESHFAYTDLPETTINLRRFLRKELEQQGFGGITSEWWHFSYRNRQYIVLDEPLCEE